MRESKTHKCESIVDFILISDKHIITKVKTNTIKLIYTNVET